jgi:hypothetical protein
MKVRFQPAKMLLLLPLLQFPEPPIPKFSDQERRILLIAHGILIAFLLVLLVYYYARLRYFKRNAPEAVRAAAAERISETLRFLSSLKGDELTAACRLIVRDLRVLVDTAWHETTIALARCSADEMPARAVLKAKREAAALLRWLHWARVLLALGWRRDAARRLVLKAVERYAAVFTPAVKQIHKRGGEWRQRIPLFEIQNLAADETDFNGSQ